MMRRLQRKILLIPICFVLLRTPETVYRALEYLHPSPAGGAVCEADASLASSVDSSDGGRGTPGQQARQPGVRIGSARRRPPPPLPSHGVVLASSLGQAPHASSSSSSSANTTAAAPFHFGRPRFANDHGFDPTDPLPEFPHGPLSVYEKGVISERERNKWLDQRIESAKRREMQDCTSPP